VEAPLEHFHTLTFPSGAAMAESMKDAELGFMPGTQFRYSNGGYAVLGYALERACARPYADYVVERILQPLGMTSSGFDPDPEIEARMVTPYHPRRGSKELIESFHPDIGGLVPSGNLYSTVEDMARFLSLQFREDSHADNGVLDAGSLAEMHAPVWMAPDWQGGMGIGWGLGRLRDRIIVNKSGATFGTTTDAAFLPDLKLGMAVFVNSIAIAPARATRTGLELLAPIVERLQRSAPSEPATPLPADAAKYTGTYVWPEMEVELEVTLADGQLMAAVDQSLAVERVALIPLEDGRFRIQGGSTSGDIARFEVDSSGAVQRLILGPYPFGREEGKH
jgi:CubicO group peptidase (beta-lactamase class C family)